MNEKIFKIQINEPRLFDNMILCELTIKEDTETYIPFTQNLHVRWVSEYATIIPTQDEYNEFGNAWDINEGYIMINFNNIIYENKDPFWTVYVLDGKKSLRYYGLIGQFNTTQGLEELNRRKIVGLDLTLEEFKNQGGEILESYKRIIIHQQPNISDKFKYYSSRISTRSYI